MSFSDVHVGVSKSFLRTTWLWRQLKTVWKPPCGTFHKISSIESTKEDSSSVKIQSKWITYLLSNQSLKYQFNINLSNIYGVSVNTNHRSITAHHWPGRVGGVVKLIVRHSPGGNEPDREGLSQQGAHSGPTGPTTGVNCAGPEAVGS